DSTTYLEGKNEVVAKRLNYISGRISAKQKRMRKQKPQTLAMNLYHFYRRRLNYISGEKEQSGSQVQTKKEQENKAMNSSSKFIYTWKNKCKPKKNKKTKATNSSNKFISILSKKTPGEKE
ncbi:22160_t:CDS:2, partial [Racocetra persica]